MAWLNNNHNLSSLLLPRLHQAVKVIIVVNRTIRYRDVVRSVGCIHSSDEVSVMEMERRGTVIQLEYL